MYFFNFSDTQIRRLSQLSFPVEHDTTYLITDRFPMRKDDDMSKDSEGTCHQSYKVKMARGIDRNEVKKTRSIRQSAKTGEISKLERLVSSETSAAASLAQELRAQLDGMEGERLHRRVRDKEVKKTLSEEARKLILELHRSEMQCCLGLQCCLSPPIHMATCLTVPVTDRSRRTVEAEAANVDRATRRHRADGSATGCQIWVQRQNRSITAGGVDD